MDYQRRNQLLVVDEELHTYHFAGEGSLSGVRLPSVTDILKPIIPESVSQYFTPESRDRGHRVHRMVQLDIEGRLDVAALDDELLSYYEGWMEWRMLANFKPIFVEQSVFHSALFYAGRMDLYGLLDGYPALPDIKTGVVDLLLAGPQTAGYVAAAAYEGLIPYGTRRFVLDMKPGRTQLTEELTDKSDKETFMACYHIWKHKQKRAA